MICSKNLRHLMLTEMAVLVISPRLGGVLRLPVCSVAGLLADVRRRPAGLARTKPRVFEAAQWACCPWA